VDKLNDIGALGHTSVTKGKCGF